MAQTTKKYQIIQKTSSTDTILLHPETDASVVKFDNGASRITSTTAQGALNELDGKIATIEVGMVTGVKGNAESTYRTGQVNLTPAQIGAESAGAVSDHNSSSTAHFDIRTSVATAQARADSAYAIADGKSRAAVFDTVAAMKTALSSAAKTDYKVGDNLYIKATEVPDYWISKVNDSKSGDYGYFEISQLETQKVDLTGYQTKNDNSLSTESKTIVGAINELEYVANLGASMASTAIEDIGKITDGTTTVGKASQATTATSATSATSAGKWTTARTITLTVNSGTKKDGSTTISGTTSQTVDGSANKTFSVNLGDSGIAASTYSAVQINAKGIAIAGGQIIEVGATGQTEPMTTLATGGLFFKEV